MFVFRRDVGGNERLVDAEACESWRGGAQTAAPGAKLDSFASHDRPLQRPDVAEGRTGAGRPAAKILSA